jgi:hypothetical protein
LLFNLFDGLAYDPEPLGAAARQKRKAEAPWLLAIDNLIEEGIVLLKKLFNVWYIVSNLKPPLNEWAVSNCKEKLEYWRNLSKNRRRNK